MVGLEVVGLEVEVVVGVVVEEEEEVADAPPAS